MVLLPLLLALPSGRDWDPSRSSARHERIARAERREHVRLALRSGAAHGYYVFDELMTGEAGMIDFLAVGPVGAVVIVVRDEPGEVTGDVDGTLFLNARPFADDPKREATEQAKDVNTKVGGDQRGSLPRCLLHVGGALLRRRRPRGTSGRVPDLGSAADLRRS